MTTLKKVLNQKNFMFKLGIIICLLWLIIAVAAPILTQSPLTQDPYNKFSPPGKTNVLGTDHLGRDVFSRVLNGSRVSITAGLITVVISFIVGLLYGSIAGYIGGMIDEIMMRFSEVIISFPPLILAMVIAAALGPSVGNSVLAMAIIWWPNYARLARCIVITIKGNDYVTASKLMGASNMRVLIKDIIPNSVGPLVVMATVDIGNAILMFSGLSFLGLGVQPPNPEWGSMVSDGVANFNYWWIATFPGLAIFSVAIGANFIGDGLRDYLDPKLRNQL